MIIRASRNNYRVPADESVTSLVSKYLRETKTDNVKVENLGGQNFLLFPAKIYQSEQHIEKFVQVATGRKMHKESEGVGKKEVSATDADMALINKFALKTLKKEEVSVYTIKVANNKIDRDMERFSDEVIDSFAKTIVGKSWLYMHNKREYMPFGKIFEAWTVVEGGVKWLVVKGYVLNSDNELVDKIDSGIWKFVSIGFTAPGFMAIQDGAGKITHFEYRNVTGKEAEGLEVSLVWLGAQFEAEITKDADNAVAVVKEARQLLSAEQLEKCSTLDDVKSAIKQEKARKELGNQSSKTKGVRSMKHLMKILGTDKVIEVGDGASDEQLLSAIQSVVDKTVDEVMAPIKAENEQLKAAAAKNKSAIDAHRESLVNATATLMNNVVKFADDAERKVEVDRLKALDLDVLQKEHDSWKAKSEKRSASPDDKSQTTTDDKEKAATFANTNGVQTII
jgi:hypothetical protein